MSKKQKNYPLLNSDFDKLKRAYFKLVDNWGYSISPSISNIIRPLMAFASDCFYSDRVYIFDVQSIAEYLAFSLQRLSKKSKIYSAIKSCLNEFLEFVIVQLELFTSSEFQSNIEQDIIKKPSVISWLNNARRAFWAGVSSVVVSKFVTFNWYQLTLSS